MIIWLLAGAVALIALVAGLRAFAGADIKTVMTWLRGAAATALGVITVYFAFTGRLIFAFLAGSLALTILGRWPSAWWSPWAGLFGPKGFRNAGGASADRSSEAVTDYLRMTLDHETGETSGAVLKGRFAGQRLEQLGREDLAELLRECRVNDPPSAELLEAYLERVFGGAAGGEPPPPGGKAAMTADEARAVLGVGANATPDEIQSAYHSLMKKLHPDQGGSNYLASQLNAAKAVLLGE